MKILDTIKSIFNQKQQTQLEELLFEKIGEGKVPWKDVYTDTLKKRLPNLVDGIKLDRVPAKNKINLNKINEQLENIEISTISLGAQAEELNHVLSRHEMFRKDDVKSFFNISRGYMDMVNNEVKDYKTNNVTVQDGIVELIPSSIIDFKIRTAEVEYFPDYMVKKSGNDPTPLNLSPGTDNDFWLSEVLTKRRGEVGAKVTIGFNGNINFNKIVLNLVGKYPVTIKTIEVKYGDDWVNVLFVGEATEKFVTLTMIDVNGNSTTYQTAFVRFTIVQKRSDFVWERDINNEEEILTSDTEKSKTIHRLIYQDEFELVKEETLKNVFSYIFGVYYMRILLQKYSSNLTGNFYSQKFFKNNSFNYVTIETTEYKPSPFGIEYKIIQHDGSFANVESSTGNIESNTKMKLLNKYRTRKVISGVSSNKILLDHYTIKEDFVCHINGISVRLVNEFDEKNDYQVMILKKYLYFNKKLNVSDTIRVIYYYYTDYIIVQAILKTNLNYATVDTPKILDFSVGLE